MTGDSHSSVRILSLHWKFSVGGVAKYAALMERVGEHADLQVRSLCILSRQHQIDEATLDGLRDKRILWRKRAWDLGWWPQLLQELSRWRPDAIMTHGFNGHFIAWLATGRRRSDVKLLASYHGEYHATTPVRRLFGLVYNRFTEYYLRQQVAGILAVAEFCRRHLLARGVDGRKITVVHNGIADRPPQAGTRERLRAEWGVENGAILIGVASRLDPVKGVEYLVQAFAALADHFPEIRLLVIGTGTLENDLRSQTESLGVRQRTIFTGFRADVPDCLEAMDIFVLPSLAEYHSIGLLEAMRAARAIIATDVGGNTESARDGKEALIVPSKNSDALAAALERMVRDPALRSRLGKAARQRFEGAFTEEQTVRRTARWMETCIRGAEGRAKVGPQQETAD